MVHADVIELVWLMVVSIAWGPAVLNALSADYDRRRYRRSPVPVQVFMTNKIFWGSMMTLIATTFALMAAVWAVFHVPPPPQIWDLPQTWMNICCWMGASTTLALYTTLSMRWRKQLSTGDYGKSADPVGRRTTDHHSGVPPLDSVIILKEKLDRATEQLKRLEEQVAVDLARKTEDAKVDLSKKTEKAVEKLDDVLVDTKEIKSAVERVDKKLPPNGTKS